MKFWGFFLCGVFLVTTFYFIAGRFHERWRKNFVVQFVYKHMYLITVGQSVSRKGMDLHPKKMVKRLRGLTVGVLILDPLNHSFSSRGCTHHLCNLTAWTVWAFSMEKRQYASSFLFPCSFFFFFGLRVNITSEVSSIQWLLNRYQLMFSCLQDVCGLRAIEISVAHCIFPLYNVYIDQTWTEHSLCYFMVFIPINVSSNYFSFMSIPGRKQNFRTDFNEAKHEI